MPVIRQYVLSRMFEASTWMGIGVSLIAAQALTAPWSYLSFFAGCMAAVLPDGKGDGKASPATPEKTP